MDESQKKRLEELETAGWTRDTLMSHYNSLYELYLESRKQTDNLWFKMREAHDDYLLFDLHHVEKKN